MSTESTEPPIVTKTDDPDHPFHLDLPWGNVGRVEIKLSTEAARALAHAILDADRHDLDAPALERVEVIDVAEHARTLYGPEAAEEMLPAFARPLPEHDYRFTGSRTGQQVTYGQQYTAAQVMASVAEDRRLRQAGL